MKLWTDLLWLLDFDLAGLHEDFLPVSRANLLKYFKKLFWKQISNNWCLRLTEHILEI